MRDTPAPKILFIRTDRLGETLLTLPAVVALKHALPGSSLTFLAHPAVAEVLVGLPELDAVLTDDASPSAPWWGRAMHLARRLRVLRFDAAVVSNPKKELHLAVFLAGIPVRVGYDRKWAWTLTHPLTDDKALGERHEVEYNLQLINRLGISV